MRILLLSHVHEKLAARKITKSLVEETISNPNSVVCGKRGRKVSQRKYFDNEKKKEYLLRVVFEERGDTKIIITAYRTSKIEKYQK
ncbi:MAG: DUF4258 domain-containing protein [Candidatus Brocadiales bacterium]|nr:DUF4258 domain-containing protein [Candidatus Brocadiales bacterium]